MSAPVTHAAKASRRKGDKPFSKRVDVVGPASAVRKQFDSPGHGRNLFHDRYKTGGYNFPTPLFANSVISFYGTPRTVLLSLEYRS